jgi:hypothetical protein
MIDCRKCDGDMEHVNWENDSRQKDFVPPRGMRVFVDLPESLKRPLVAQHVETMRVKEEEKEAIIARIMSKFHEGEPYEGEPYIITV